jgi:putative heme-binding domain-containing protein
LWPDHVALLGQLAAVVGTRNKADEVNRVLGLIAGAADRPKDMRRDLLLGLGDGVLRTGKTLHALALPPAARSLLDDLVREAEQTAANDKATEADRTQAIQLLAHAAFDSTRSTFRRLLGVRQPQEVQLAAVRALRATGTAGVPALLLDAWSGFTPPVRGEAVATLSSRGPWALALLDAVAAKKVPANHVDSARRAVLVKHRDAAVRAKAGELLRPGDTPRADVVASARTVLDLPGDAQRGRAVFQRECASCHLAGSMGHNVGPSIASLGIKSPDELLVSILDPNREVDPRYVNYTVTTTDGRTTAGVIVAETPAAVMLKRADGSSETVLRAQIEELSSTGQSLMPEGFEEKIKDQEMADLIAFLLAVARGS